MKFGETAKISDDGTLTSILLKWSISKDPAHIVEHTLCTLVYAPISLNYAECWLPGKSFLFSLEI